MTFDHWLYFIGAFVIVIGLLAMAAFVQDRLER